MKKILAHMAEGRTLQTTVGNLTGATRFEASTQGKIWHTVCLKFKTATDSWSHCAKCYKQEVGTIKNEKQWLANIKTIAQHIKTATPAKFVTSKVIHEHYD